jgi:hypothetical protein
MAINRKLQAEIDRVLKRVQEGIQEFGQTWYTLCYHTYVGYTLEFIWRLQTNREKVAGASNTNLKEKHGKQSEHKCYSCYLRCLRY